MKKIILILSVVTLAFTSCSKNEPAPNAAAANPNGVLLRKIIVTEGSDVITKILTYNGNKLVSIKGDDGYTSNFTYTGNLITSGEEIDANGIFDSYDTFEYDSSARLILFKRFQGGIGGAEFVRESYVYNADGTATITDIGGNTKQLFFLNGEIIKVVRSTGNTKNYTYDTKNNPFKNITGVSKLNFNEGDLSFTEGISKNVLTKTNTINADNYNYQYVYNALNFPTTCSVTYNENGSPGTETIKYFYE
jgi:hypothetical protein